MDKDLARFLSKVRIAENGCWIWTAAINKETGYGVFWAGGKCWSAHRYAYTQFKGEVSSRLHLDHDCETRACCNPECVHPKTPLDHKRRHLENAVQTEITHCPYGHEHSETNTYVNKRGRKVCKLCMQTHRERWRAKSGKLTGIAPRERTQCPHGHPYDEANTKWYQGRRYCKACRPRLSREWRERHGKGEGLH